MAIKYTNFIKININKRPEYSATSTREEAVLIVKADAAKTYNLNSSNYLKSEAYTTYTKQLDYFFLNGGHKLVIKATNKELTATNINAIIDDLPIENIVIAIEGVENSILATVAGNYNNHADGAENKIILANITDIKNLDSLDTANNLVYKYGEEGSELSIAAYLTKLNIDNNDSVKDYAFTVEAKVNDDYIINKNADAEKLLKANINFIGNLANQNRNLGGDDSNGNDIINVFVNIMMQQTLSEKLMNVLASKIKYDVNGLNIISANLTQELQRYLACGYLTTSKQWTDDAWTVVENGITYTIIGKNIALDKGFKFTILPFSSLTAEEKKNHQLPKIFLVIADNYSVRSITISGEII